MSPDDVLGLVSQRAGQFLLESGHHGELWLDLERLFERPERVEPLVAALAARLGRHEVAALCGPLTGGAFLALRVAGALGVSFAWAEPVAPARAAGLFPVAYRLPEALRSGLRGRRVAVVDDVINAGSAARGALSALRDCGAEPVALAALLVLGEGARALAASEGLPLEALASAPSRIWPPSACPLCERAVPLSRMRAPGR